MRILIVRSFPSIINIEHYNVQEIGLAKALTKMGHECGIVFYHGFHKSRVEEIVVEGTDGKITIYWQRAVNLFKNGIFFGLSSIMKQYDVIQVHEYDQLTSWWYYSFGRKEVVVYHGPYECAFNRGYNLKCKIFDHTFLKLCRRKDVMCLTKSPLAAEFLTHRGFTNVHTVGVGLDTTEYENAGMPVCTEAEIRLLYVGKIEERRNVYLIEEIMRCLNGHPEIILTMIGNGEPEYVKDFLQKIDDLIKQGKIRYIASVKQKEMAEVYQEHDILLFPTNYDIFGMVLLEAMYCGECCISSRNGGAVSVIEDHVNGLILEEFAASKWSEAILELAKDADKRNSMKQAGRETIRAHFTWENVARRFEGYYQEVIEGRILN